MTSTILLLEKYVKACSHASDSAAARALKVQPSAVNNWRHGRAHPNAEAVERMCAAINEALPHWLALIEAERARTPADKRVWLRLAQMAAAIAGAFLILRHGGGTHAITAFVFSPVYIMRNRIWPWWLARPSTLHPNCLSRFCMSWWLLLGNVTPTA